MNLLQLFKSLQNQRRGLAIVLDEFGGVSGVRDDGGHPRPELVGKIRVATPRTGRLRDGKTRVRARWRVSGTMRLDDFRREYPALGQVDEVETLGGLIDASAGHCAGHRGIRRVFGPEADGARGG
jgi:CBS domain containing-hemolysin-like protein